MDKRLQMAHGILRDIYGGASDERTRLEPDATADINFFLGDLNFRLNRTYSEHVSEVYNSPQMVPQYD